MTFTIRHRFAKFLPGETERITGVNAVKQRDWRRHGHLPGELRSWNEFELPDLAALRVMQLLSDLGLGPKRSKEAAHCAATAIVFETLQHQSAYDVSDNIDPNGASNSARKIALSISPFKGVLPGGTYFLVWPDGYWYAAQTVEPVINDPQHADRRGQAVAVLNIVAIADEIRVKAERPLVSLYRHYDKHKPE